MSIETFSKEQFEQELTTILTAKGQQALFVHLGIQLGEHCYSIPIPDTNKRVFIRSSVKKGGKSAGKAQDSIRVYAQYFYKKTWYTLGRVDKYTTRMPGWQVRLGEKLRALYKMCLEDSKAGPGEARSSKQERKTERANDQASSGGDLLPLAGGGVSPEPPQAPPPVLGFAVTGEVGSVDEEPDASAIPADAQCSGGVDLASFTLNSYQQAIVDNGGKGAHVVEACPGSGKTRTLESLVAQIIQDGANPLRVGAFTFSKKAAAEMRRRIAHTIWPDAPQAQLDFFESPDDSFSREWVRSNPIRRMLIEQVCTIHALSYRLLKRYAEAKGQAKPKVLSGKLQWEADNLIKDSLDELRWTEGPKPVKAWISHLIINLIPPHQALEWVSARLPDDCIHHAGKLAEIYKRYYDYCKLKNVVDFDMMQARVVLLLEREPGFQTWAAGLFDYVLVDEAQDTSPQQSKILFALAQKTGNIAFVGDVDQSMYKFRGAEPEILRSKFKSAWGEVQRFNLPVNYRSTQAIVASSAGLIGHNYTQDSEYLKPFQHRPDAPKGLPVSYTELPDFDTLVDETCAIVDDSFPGDWFILSRTRAECATIHTGLIAAGIPAINKSGGLLFGASHIRKALAYLRLACDYQDARNDQEILGEIASVASVNFRAPYDRRRHISTCSKTKSWDKCSCPLIAEEGKSYSHTRFYGRKAIQAAGNWQGVKRQTQDRNRGGYLTTKAKGSRDLVGFVEILEQHKDNAVSCLSLILSDCLIPWLAASQGAVDTDLAENGDVELFDVLAQLISPRHSVKQFLTKVDRLASAGSIANEHAAVLIGTIHWSKGAEREKVIVNTTRLPIVPPARKTGQLPTGGGGGLEEERRLLFVAMTRAKSEVHILGSKVWNEIETSPDKLVKEVLG